jgi:hypothetical protein
MPSTRADVAPVKTPNPPTMCDAPMMTWIQPQPVTSIS